MNKYFKTILFLFIVFLSPINIKASEVNNHIQYSSIIPYADKTVWKYNIFNGRLYKRLWNETKQRWDTDWIPC